MRLSHDARVALRTLARRPSFTVTALLTIAIAIGGNTAIFSMVRGVLLAPLPFAEPRELVTLDARASTGYRISTSVPNYRDWVARSRVFQASGAAASWSMSVTGKGPATAINVGAVLGNFFGTLGSQAMLGRLITPDETEPGGAAVAVLTSGYWQRLWGSDPGIVGRSIVLDGRPYVVVGVLRQGAEYPGPDVDAYVSLGSLPGLPWNDRRRSFGMRTIARLGPGISLETARGDLERVGREVRDENAADTALPELRSFDEFFVGDVRWQVWLLMGAVAFVLLIAVANVANLLLARGEERRQEMAVRTALGAGRSVLVRQVLTESVVLSLAGGVLGLVLAALSLKLLLALLAGTVPDISLPQIRLDHAVLLFATALTVLTGLLFGLIPALRMSRIDLGEIRIAGRGLIGTRDRLRSALIVSELALAVILLVGAGLMIRSVAELRNVDKGFDPTNVLSARVSLPRPEYRDSARWQGFYRDAIERLGAEAGVRSAAATLLLPLSDRSSERGIWPEGTPPTPGTGQSVLYNVVSPEYFETLGVSIVRGRRFGEADRTGAPPVAIIDETMAARFWPGDDPVGKRITFETVGGDHHGEPIYRTVVGVAQNVRHYELANPSRIQVYVPWTQLFMGATPELALIARTTTHPAALVPALRRIVAELDEDIPISDVRPVDEYVTAGLASSHTVGDLLAVFGGTALLLASVGIFGVMSYTVAQRTREIGLRMALGASAPKVLRWVTGRALGLGTIGVLVGAGAAAALSRLLTRMLFQVSPLDPTVYAGVGLLLLVAVALAAFLPARRAAAVDPGEAMRE